MQRLSSLTCATLVLASVLSTVCPAHVHADDPLPDTSYRNVLWVTGSGALLGASLAGMLALKSSALHDRAASLLPDAAELPGLERDARNAARLSVGFGVGAALFATVSIVLLVRGPSSFAAPRGEPALALAAGPGMAGVTWHGAWP